MLFSLSSPLKQQLISGGAAQEGEMTPLAQEKQTEGREQNPESEGSW